MKRTALLCAVALVLFQAVLCAAARADDEKYSRGYMSQGKLQHALQSAIPEDNSVAEGYITGVIDVHNKIMLDVPQEAKTQQLVDIVRNCIDPHPEDAHYMAYQTIVLCIIEKFPLKEKSSKQHSAIINGDKLYNLLDSYAISQQLFGLGYIIGVVDSYNEKVFKTPNHFLIKYVVDIVHDYLKIHPEKRQEMAHRLVAAALSEKYPLKNPDNRLLF